MARLSEIDPGMREFLILDIGYSHLVFTLPRELNPLAQRYPVLIYRLLFQAASQTLRVRHHHGAAHLESEPLASTSMSTASSLVAL